jgi:hypothetical protein
MYASIGWSHENVMLGETFYTLFSALEFGKIFRGRWEKIKIKLNFLTICSV